MKEIENSHLDAIRNSDFVWIESSDGYIGNSACLEIGYANALGIPVFSKTHITDVTIGEYVEVKSPSEAVEYIKTQRPRLLH